MKLAASALAALVVMSAAWRGCEQSRARPGKRSAWWGWWRASGAAVGGGGAAAAGARPVDPGAMCITLGEVAPLDGARFRVSGPKVRGYGIRSGGRAAELRFVYRGPTREVSRLGSGRVFRQLGLKLNAQDGCNAVYVMWRLEPATGIEVLVKRNPGQSVHAECGNRGYRKVKPAASRPVPRLQPGSSHRLRAELSGSRLIARVDGDTVLEAEVGELGFSGPAGFRTDNVETDLELVAIPSDAAVPCTRGGD